MDGDWVELCAELDQEDFGVQTLSKPETSSLISKPVKLFVSEPLWFAAGQQDSHLDIDSNRSLKYHALYLYRIGRYEQALEMCLELRIRNPGSLACYQLDDIIVRILKKQEKWESVLKTIRLMMEDKKHFDLDILLIKSQALMEMNQKEECLESLLSVLDHRPKLIQSWELAGSAFSRFGDDDLSINCFLVCIHLLNSVIGFTYHLTVESHKDKLVSLQTRLASLLPGFGFESREIPKLLTERFHLLQDKHDSPILVSQLSKLSFRCIQGDQEESSLVEAFDAKSL